MRDIAPILVKVATRQELDFTELVSLKDWGRQTTELQKAVADLSAIVDGYLKTSRPSEVSDITDDLGTFRAAAILSGTDDDPRRNPTTYSGIAEIYPGVTIGGDTYNILGMNAGVLTFGLSALTGKVYAYQGVIGGWTIATTQLVAGTGSNVVGFDTSGSIAIYAGNSAAEMAPFQVNFNGSMIASNATITGTIYAGAGTIGGWVIGEATLSSGSITLDAANYNIRIGNATTIMTGEGVFTGYDAGVYKLRVGNPSGNYLLWDGTYLIASGQWIKSAGLNPALQEWKTNIVFSSASASQVNWSAGMIQLSDGTTYNITTGNTGTMLALTYIYLDIAVSQTVLQKTTSYSTAVGDGKILIAAAQNNVTAASVIPFSGQQPVLDGAGQIAALSITADSIAAGAVTASKISVANLQAISANMGALNIDNKLTLSGASSAIAIGTTPPTSPTTGTGIWVDRTGFYGLNANTQQVVLYASDGTIKAGGGNLILDYSGITLLVGTGVQNKLKYDYGATLLAFLQVDYNAGLQTLSSQIEFGNYAGIVAASMVDLAVDNTSQERASITLTATQVNGPRALIEATRMVQGQTAYTITTPVGPYTPLTAFMSIHGVQAVWNAAYSIPAGAAGLTIADIVGRHDLSNTNAPYTTGFTTGYYPTVPYIHFTATSMQNLFRATELVFAQSNTLGIYGWLRLTTKPGVGSVFGLIKNGDSTEQQLVYITNSDGNARLNYRTYNTNNQAVVVTNTTILNTGVWYYFAAQYTANYYQILWVNRSQASTAVANLALRAPGGNFVVGSHGGAYWYDGDLSYFAYQSGYWGAPTDREALGIFESTRGYYGV